MNSSFVGKSMPTAERSAVRPSRATTLRTNALLKLKPTAKKAAPKKAEAPAGLSFLPGFKLGDAKPKQTLKVKGSKAIKKAAASEEAPFGIQLPGIRIDDIPQPGNIDPIFFALGLSGVTIFLIAGLLFTS